MKSDKKKPQEADEVVQDHEVDSGQADTPSDAADASKTTDEEKTDDAVKQRLNGITVTDRRQSSKNPIVMLKHFWAAIMRHKRWSLPLLFVVLVGILMAVPFTRYSLLGLGLQKDFQVVVLDEKTQKPVTKASVTVGGKTLLTDNKGRLTLHTKVGNQKLTATKKYYKTNETTVLVPIAQKNGPFKIFVKATGRQVPVVIVNKINGKPVADVLIKAEGSEVKTDKEGKAVLVVPADKTSVKATISVDKYNSLTSDIRVTEQAAKENTFSMVPAGKVYFLSKLSGKIDVVKTNLDGSQRQTVLAGTGNEDNYDTVLLASRDWKYLALKTKRDGGEYAKLFLIDTSDDKLTNIDEGKAFFTSIGWSEHRFVYTVGRIGVQNWQPKGQALKSFDAPTKKITLIDETEGEGSSSSDYANTIFSTVFIMDSELVYQKYWNSQYCYYCGSKLEGKQLKLTSVKADGSAKKTIKEFPVPSGTSYYSLELRLYAPKELYVRAQNGQDSVFYEYEDGKIEQKKDVSDQTFNNEYPTFLLSPSGKQTLWSESRDGKNSLFMGDNNGGGEKQIASLSEMRPYGWFSDDYLFVTKKGSELYILPAGNLGDRQPIKVTDYHKPNGDFSSYGGGYGGL